MVKYEPQYAKAIGKFMLNVVNASRLFYPEQVEEKYQWLPHLKDITHGIIGYEGVRKTDDMNNPALLGISPVSIGDGPKWVSGQPEEAMFSLYSTSIAGVFGAIVQTTDVEGILSLDCNATDFYAENKYPVHLYYNPYPEAKTISVKLENASDLYDLVSGSYLAKNTTGSASVQIPAGEAVLVVSLPSGTKLKKDGKKLKAGNTVIAYK